MSKQLLTSHTIGAIGSVANRIAMAAMTRARSSKEHVPTQLQVEHYKARASAGLLLTEGTFISPQAVGWERAPGIWSEEQVDAWRKVTDAVHKEGGKIAVQLWHTGRAAHSSQRGGELPVAPSAIALKGKASGTNGEKEYETPRALTVDEITGVVQDFASAARNAITAGFDGVEIHGANGYLVDQFLNSVTNKRTDKYGGSVQNQVRFLTEVVDAVAAEIGADRVGVKLSPNGVFNQVGSPEFREVYTEALRIIADRRLAFVEVTDGLDFGFHKLGEAFTLKEAREIIRRVQGDNVVTTLIGNCGYTLDTAEAAVAAGDADLISFGRPFLGEPHLVDAVRKGAEPAAVIPYAFFYAGDEKGYTDLSAKA